MKSKTLPVYKSWLKTANPETIEFVDSVYAICEEHYDCGGDVIVECYEPEQVADEFKHIGEVRNFCGLIVENATNKRWGEDSDPEVVRSEQFRREWGE